MKSIQITKDTSNVIKGLACLLIVAHHFCARLMAKGFDDVLTNFIGVRGGVVGVAIFFFLSAWGLSESQKRNNYSFIAFVKRRLSKVYFPLIITNFLYYFFLVGWDVLSFSYSDLILSTLNLRLIDGVLWFCNTILIFYLIFYLSFLPKKNWAKVALCMVLTLLYSFVSTWIYPDAPFYVYSIIGFPFGMVCSMYKDSFSKMSVSGIWMIACLLLLMIGALSLPAYRNLFLMNSFCLILLFVLLTIIQRVSFSARLVVLPFIGIYSYEIYLLHNKVLSPLGNAGYTTWYPLVFLLLVIPLAVLLSKSVKL